MKSKYKDSKRKQKR